MLSNGYVRRGGLALWDVGSWGLATAVVVGVRHDFNLSEVLWDSVLAYWLLASALLLAIGYATKFYRGRYLVGSFDEATGLALLLAVVGALTLGMSAAMSTPAPRSVVVLAPPMALLISAAGRLFYRALRDRLQVDDSRPAGRRVLIYGAGDAGRQVLHLLRGDADEVVGFLDDNPGKRHLRISGVPVLGDGSQLAAVGSERDAGVVVLAIPSANGAVIDRAQKAAQAAGIDVLVLPRVAEMIGGQVSVADIRPVEIGDVLGRHQVSTSVTEIAGYLTGKRVLITGAGGSIGSELARQVHNFGPATMIMLDRDESALLDVQLSIFGHGLLDAPDTVLCDIRDRGALEKVFAEHQPEIVFHAAALKHLPMLERFPDEGWKTNVLGTLNLLRLSELHRIAHFVNISTDKAADSTSVLGTTKRIAEQLTAWHAERGAGHFISVRFGNVLGSRGSMLHTFNAQIEAGGPITVTHPDVTRYFMTIPEACELVVQAGTMGRSGDVMVLEMGTPVKILDVAHRMIELSHASGVDIVFTGLRPGEKLHERLFSDEECPQGTSHPMIRTVAVPAADPAELSDLAHAVGDR
ncbi:nucleoside-diphosphate sugar epimerase/dehydratase [Nocardioides sp.]|uniref:polysaccharide biosynthesis protein n=1 Tax=Nocardioides sp. TaxID=35761 RepID=UPI00263455E8|nr:nucleoside-diphosphate sugar epimerase/dehydratase [Nocardioides sp.]MCW2738735.1 polysaccharide biosynthesis protein [Nocardioides sp.]